MANLLGGILSERALAEFVGREDKMEALLDVFEKGGPVVVHVHGIAGIGKTSLLEAFAVRARQRGGRVVLVDCRAVEPTARGFLSELSAALGEDLSTVEDASQRLASFAEIVVVVLDTYEAFRLLDTWIRQVFGPSLPVNTRLVLAGRNPPSPGWLTTPGWHRLFRNLVIEQLSEKDAHGYLEKFGIPPELARRINRSARGHPLALSMAASIVLSEPERRLEETSLHQVIDQLAQSYIEAVPDAVTRLALEASSVVRCVTEPLLQAILPGTAPRDTMERLRVLPFVESGREGLFIHDAVRHAVATSLAARDTDAYHEYRRAAWAYLKDRLSLAVSAEQWRYTADILFLLENPVLREGFFPRGPHPLSVEPATPGDEAAVRDTVATRSAPELEALMAWWHYHRDGFQIIRDHGGSVCGFYIVVRGSELDEAVAAADPVAAAWRRHYAERGSSVALFCRRWLDSQVGEASCPTQAASWIDLKRTYLEIRKTLRWVYMALSNPRPYGEVATRLGFRPLPDQTVEVGGQTLYSFVLDMGPESFDGWLTERLGAEIREERKDGAKVLDVDARELVLPWGRIGLTSLEFGVMRYLQEHPGKAIGRYDLMEAVWGYRNPTASNVVDVVIRALRRKLGAACRTVETVRGTGYRYRSQPPAR